MLSEKEYKDKKRKLRKVNVKSLTITTDLINSKVFLYEDGIEVGNYTFEVDFKKKDMFVNDLEIESQYREKGYGSYLARHMEILARLYHLKSISLTDGANPDGFWQIMGYKRRKIKQGTVRLDLI